MHDLDAGDPIEYVKRPGEPVTVVRVYSIHGREFVDFFDGCTCGECDGITTTQRCFVRPVVCG